VLVHHLCCVERLLCQDLSQLLPPLAALVLIAQTHNLNPNSPNLPGDIFWRKWPPCSPTLEKLQGYLARPLAWGGLDVLCEGEHLPPHQRVQGWGVRSDVCVINGVTVYVLVPNCAYTVRAFGLVAELSQRPVEQDRMEKRQDRVLYLTTLHRNLEHVRPGVHCPTSGFYDF